MSVELNPMIITIIIPFIIILFVITLSYFPGSGKTLYVGNIRDNVPVSKNIPLELPVQSVISVPHINVIKNHLCS